MTTPTSGVIAAADACDGVVWSILGQTYTLKQVSDASMAWHAEFPKGTFVPPHVHPTQEEYIYVLSGQYRIWLGGKEQLANPGDLVCMPRGIPHGIFNNLETTATSLFWVAPTGQLQRLFERIHLVGDPAEVVRLAAEHEVDFLKP